VTRWIMRPSFFLIMLPSTARQRAGMPGPAASPDRGRDARRRKGERMKRRRGNNFLEQRQAKRETAKRAAAAKAEREPKPADPEVEEPTPEPAPSATEEAGAA
jgi:hypothetical protein